MLTRSALLAAALAASLLAAPDSVYVARRQRAAAAFHDGVLLLHANSTTSFATDGFHQDPLFYYFTGLENTVAAILAIDGKSGDSWLFLPTHPPLANLGLKPEVVPGAVDAQRLGIQHVSDWTSIETFVSHYAGLLPLYYAADPYSYPEMPFNIAGAKTPNPPSWFSFLQLRWPTIHAREARDRIVALLAVQTPDEAATLRSAAKATVAALMTGVHTVRPGATQSLVEAGMAQACVGAGAHGPSFWPWAMAGENAIVNRAFTSRGRYDHLNSTLRPGDLVRLEVGCESDHYQGDLGRTVPVSGRFTPDQRETWDIFVAAYRAGVAALRDGVTAGQVFERWRDELLRHRAAARTSLAQRAIDSWSQPQNVPFWQIHTTNLVFGHPTGPLQAGTTANFEPAASIDGQGYYLEDMFLITHDGAELLTPGVPSTADEIESAMRGR